MNNQIVISNEHLRELENEAIFVMREVAAQFENKVLLFSGGKDSIVLVHLARKAFWPAKIPFTLMHIDTGHNFEETLKFRDDLAKEFGADLVVKYVQDSIDKGRVKEEQGINASRNKAQSVTLLDAVEEHKIDVAIGGGRRDEEKARAKERFFSHRNEFGQWDPKNQRPELWNIFNGKKNQGEHFRVFPISNWTELDVWQYILTENIKLPSLYYTHRRKIFSRNGTYLAWAPFMQLKPNEEVFEADVRCRTIGDITCTGVTLSKAQSLEEIIAEIAATRVTERGGRYDDKRSEAAMEDRKKGGVFLGCRAQGAGRRVKSEVELVSLLGGVRGVLRSRFSFKVRSSKFKVQRLRIKIEMTINGKSKNKSLLRFTTAGSVDDGKSTLIGRLLYDSKSIFEDQMEHIVQSGKRLGREELDLSLLTDGLRAEREQGITIDVAYRYFATPARKFIIADTPGHIQYTRNMVTGASTVDLAVILIDARKGVLEQTLRHSYIASLLDIKHIIFCINKMDMVNWSESVYNNIKIELAALVQKLEIEDAHFIPISAKYGR